MLSRALKLRVNFLLSRKNFTIKYPEKNIRMADYLEKQEDKPVKIEEIKYSSKFSLDLDTLDDYTIIGAEIFRNALKDDYVNNHNKVNNIEEPKISKVEINLDMVASTSTQSKYNKNYKFKKDTKNYINFNNKNNNEGENIYFPKEQLAGFQEPNKYTKHMTNRTFYDHAVPSLRPLFVPSYRDKVEPYNTLKIFKWGLLNGNKKDHKEHIFRRNNYVEGFIPPFKTNNNEVDKILNDLKILQDTHNIDYNSENLHKIMNDMYNDPAENDEEYIRKYVILSNDLLDLISGKKLNHKAYAALLLNLFYDLGMNNKKIWIAIEQEILNNLHHYIITELCQIMFIASISSPKFSSNHFRSILFDVVRKNLIEHKLSLEELHTVCFAFRNLKHKQFYNDIAENFLSRKDEFLKTKKENVPGIIAKIFYSYANHKPKEYTPDTYYPQRDLIEKFIETYEDDLNNYIPLMNQDDISRLTTALYLLKSDNIDPFINRIERNVLKNKDKIDAFNLHNVIRAFSKMKSGKMCGSDKFFNEMEPIVIEHLNNFKFNFQQFSDILFAYSVRKSGSENLYRLFNQKINQDLNEHGNNYHILANITWHLLFEENKNVDIWHTLMKKYNSLEGKLPIFYYRPFKLAAFFMENAIGVQEELGDGKIDYVQIFEFKDRFYDCEQIYDYVKYEKTAENHKEYSSMMGILGGKHFLTPLPHVIHENTFIIHYYFQHQKMGINIWLDRDKVPKTSNPVRIKRDCLLHSKLMNLIGWEILDISWEEFFNLNSQEERDNLIHQWYYSTLKKQQDRGIAPKEIKYI